MRPLLLRLLCFSLLLSGCRPSAGTKSAAAQQIRQVLRAQEAAWNEGNLEGYMQGYWQSDSLAFIGKRGLTYGWRQTLENYRKSYPDQAAMGKLTFRILKTEQLAPDAAYVVGQWHLQRAAGDLDGHFSLLWRLVNGRWVIVSDHSS